MEPNGSRNARSINWKLRPAGLSQTVVLIVLLALNWAGWVVMLGGISAFTAKCDAKDGPTTDGRLSLTDLSGFVNCAYYYALSWWAVWFQFVVLVMFSAHQFAPAIRSPRLGRSTLAFLAMASGLMMVTANSNRDTIDWLKPWHSLANSEADDTCAVRPSSKACSTAKSYSSDLNFLEASMEALLGGAIICIILNMVLIIISSGEEATPATAPPAQPPIAPGPSSKSIASMATQSQPGALPGVGPGLSPGVGPMQACVEMHGVAQV